ncbi:HesB/IscA family protein [Buchnera aphidicola]|uniref:Protein SufA n=1 Tax=Buchnera aphidicola (Cinara strobi) TaxID=1921549 RepID=A0A3B1E7Q1_9GAMM|nr:iron-sulfur cluster assembly accessory protein [Buchnera aphidicola]VAX76327.1 Protein SufA [Buchnera aphidicola (Cinara strobi)]
MNNQKKNKKKSVPITIKITEKAKKQILFLIKKQKKNKHIKIKIKKSGCAGIKYQLILSNKIKNSDYIFYTENITFIFSKKWITLLNNIKIDFLTKGLTSSFIFINPKHTSTCGCGESFKI